MQRQCSICEKNFNDSETTMIESGYYEPKSKPKEGYEHCKLGFGVLHVINQLDCSEERKRAAIYDLEHNYNKIVEKTYCEKCFRTKKED